MTPKPGPNPKPKSKKPKAKRAAAPVRLFVYGSLRSDIPDAARHASGKRAFAHLRAEATSEGSASLPGRLYAVAWYPGYVPARTPRIQGEIWRLENPALLLAALDAYEGDPYVREVRTARFADGRRAACWVYRYVGDVSGAREIDSGDYRRWVRTKGRAD